MTVTAASGYQLVLGSLELMENDWGLYRIDVLGADASFGNTAPVSEVISSLMIDGDLTTSTRFGNRVAVFDVTVTAADPGGLAAGEAALMAEIDRVNTLTWHVPFGAATVFDVVRSWPEHQFDDLSEVLQRRRRFRLSFECLPFGRSVEPVVLSWSDPARELDPVSSLASWTVVSGSASYTAGDADDSSAGFNVKSSSAAASVRLRKTVTLDEYLWFKVRHSGYVSSAFSSIWDVTVDGVAIPNAEVRLESEGVSVFNDFYTVPTGSWRGRSAVVEFTLRTPTGGQWARLNEFWSTVYPSTTPTGATRPGGGISVIDVAGSARTPVLIQFTAPAGGAFVYTAPDPNVSIRERGAAEAVFGHFTVTSADGAELGVGSQLMWFPQGTHSTNIGVTAAQPVELNPNGIWPQQGSGQATWDGTATIAAGAYQFAYPVDAKAAVTFYDTSGAKTVLSPSPALPEGYHGDAVHHEVHSLHPGRCGFAVLDKNGAPIPATVTYYPRWWNHAAQ